MFGKKKISDPPSPVENDQLSAEVLDKHRQIICRSELVAGDKELAAAIVAQSKLISLPKSHALISQGDRTDEVYFILFGSVCVSINSNQIDTKTATETVGEMAAMRPGAARTATVTVDTSNFEARVISAHDFRGLMANHEAFRERLSNMESTMNRKNIDLLGKSKGSFKNTWTWTSIIFGVAVGALCGLWFGLGGSSAMMAAIYAICAGALGTLISIRWNPDFIFRNMFWLTCCAILAQVIQTTYSLSFSINGGNHRLPFLWNFSSNPEQKWWSVAIIYMTLFGLAWMCWRADQELRGNQKNNE